MTFLPVMIRCVAMKSDCMLPSIYAQSVGGIELEVYSLSDVGEHLGLLLVILKFYACCGVLQEYVWKAREMN